MHIDKDWFNHVYICLSIGGGYGYTYFFGFHPENWGRWTQFDYHIFWMGGSTTWNGIFDIFVFGGEWTMILRSHPTVSSFHKSFGVKVSIWALFVDEQMSSLDNHFPDPKWPAHEQQGRRWASTMFFWWWEILFFLTCILSCLVGDFLRIRAQ